METNYYAVIPADVRYDKELSSDAKLLYVEISALCNKEGYCWASNQYFEELFEASKMTISRRINELINRGHITRQVVMDGKLVKERRLYLVSKMIPPSIKIDTTPSIKNDTYNNYNYELNNINKEKYIKRNAPTLEEVEKYVKEKDLNVNAKDFFDYYEAGDWSDANGKKVKNWKQKAMTWSKRNGTKKPQYESSSMDISDEEVEEFRKRLYGKTSNSN